LVGSCGSGIDVFYLRKFYQNAKYFVTDLSQNAVDTAKASLHSVEGQVEDAENLSFPDNHFDYGFMAASLHHLPRPILGLYELLRVSKHGVIVIEPNDTWVTRLATRMGLATEVEPAGNYVFRLGKHDIERISKSLFLPYEIDRFFAIHRIAKSPIEFQLLKLINATSNLICPSLGNYIVALIKKPH
jgi:ubiquinone/menaquinone biosynthesis C-methylase UbiE